MRLNLLTGRFEEDRKQKRKSPEADIGKQVDAYLKSIGCYMRTIKSDGTKMEGGQWRRSSQGSGISDRIGIMPGGRFIAVELKATGKKRTATDEQHNFLLKIIENGGVGCIADSIEDVKLALSQTKEEMLLTLQKLRTKKRAVSHAPLFP